MEYATPLTPQDADWRSGAGAQQASHAEHRRFPDMFIANARRQGVGSNVAHPRCSAYLLKVFVPLLYHTVAQVASRYLERGEYQVLKLEWR